MASFPTSVKSFTTRTAGQTIMKEHINELQDEVNAVETSLLSGWQSYTFSARGSTGSAGTFAITNLYGRYKSVPGLCYVVARGMITNVGSWGGDAQFALPMTPYSGGLPPRFGIGWVYAAGASVSSPKAIINLSGIWTGAYKSIVTTMLWSDIAVNDWIFINGSFEITMQGV